MPARLRPPTDADAGAVLDLILARDVADLGVPDFTMEDLKAEWSGVELEHDIRVANGPDGRLDGYAILLGDDAVVLVHPEGERKGLGTVLRRWAEARAAERGTSTVRQFAVGSNQRSRRLLKAAGYEPAQHYFRLRADLSELPPAPDAPLRTYRSEDLEPVHALVQEAFEEIEGNTPEPLDRWRAKRIEKEGFDPALWLLLEDQKGLAGVALGERWENGTGYVGELAVAPRARGLGHGRTLLLGAFDAFRRAGLRHAELNVHGRNRGALRLYVSVGMRPTWEAERWEKPLGG
jgi:mycothiol synthase